MKNMMKLLTTVAGAAFCTLVMTVPPKADTTADQANMSL